MSASASLDQRARRELREQAIWRTKVAGYAAFASATVAVIVFGAMVIDTGEWQVIAPYLLGAGLTFGFGAGVYFGRSQVAAAVLMILATSTMILRVIQTGTFGGLVIGGVLVYCYAQGFRGAMELAELEKSDASAPVEQAL